jgi:exosortase B
VSSQLARRFLPRDHAGGCLRWLPVMAGAAAMYVPTYVRLGKGLWNEEAHAHGPLVLAVIAWLLWRERAALAGCAGTPAPVAGGLTLALGLLLYLVGRSQGIALFEVGSHLPVLAGAVLLLLGWRALARLWFPVLFLVFLVPLPGFVIDAVTSPLKSIVSQAVEATLYPLGYPIARSGVMLGIGQYQLLVADACSGLNSLYSLAALGLLYIYVMAPGTRIRNAIMVASIVPIALAANFVRVLLLVLITFHVGDAAGQGFLHGFAGIMLFATALALLLGLDALLRWLPPRRAEARP